MGDVKPQPEQSLDDYLAWLEDTPPDQLPSGEDVSDLGMLGRTLRSLLLGVLAAANGRVASTRPISARTTMC